MTKNIILDGKLEYALKQKTAINDDSGTMSSTGKRKKVCVEELCFFRQEGMPTPPTRPTPHAELGGNCASKFHTSRGTRSSSEMCRREVFFERVLAQEF